MTEMNGNEVLRVVDALHRDKNIDKEIVFEGIEQAILSAARKHFGEDFELEVTVDREHGEPTIKCNGQDLYPDELGAILGRVTDLGYAIYGVQDRCVQIRPTRNSLLSLPRQRFAQQLLHL